MKRLLHIGIVAGVSIVGAVFFAFSARALVGPTASGGVGSGAIGVDSQNNVSVGTSTTDTATKFLVVASSSADTSSYSQKIKLSNGTPVFYVRNDGAISVGTSSVSAGNALTVGGNFFVSGTITGSFSAANVSAGTFGSNVGNGNFSFPANLGIGTASPGVPLSITSASSEFGRIVATGGVAAYTSYNTSGAATGYIGQECPAGTCIVGSGSAFANDLVMMTTGASPNLRFATNAAVRMTVTGAGNVGIGVASPTDKLDVNGNLTVSSGNVRGSGFGNNVSGDTFVFNDGAAGVALQTAGTTKLYVASSGSVGIGTASPRNQLEVGPAANTTIRAGGIYRGTGSGFTANGQETSRHQLAFSSWRDIVTDTIGAKIVAINKTALGAAPWDLVQNTDLAFYTLGVTPTSADNTAEVMRLTSSGNVGIGTSAPTSLLTVAGEIKTTSGGVRFPDGTLQTTAATGGGGAQAWTTSGTNVSLTTSTNSVGIGTASPLGVFAVNPSGASANNWVYFTNNTGSGAGTPSASANSGLIFGWNPSGAAGESQILYGTGLGSSPRLDFGRWSGSVKTVDMSLSGGNVGIGTTGPRAKVEVNGGIINTAAVNANGNLSSYDLGVGSIGAQTVYGYTGMCTGNASGACNSNSGVVLGIANTAATVDIPNSGTVFFNGGNVGIGTTAPSGKLQIESSGDVAFLQVDTTSTANKRTRINFSQNGTLGMEIGTDSGMNSTTDLYFYNRASAQFAAIFAANASGGKLTIGTIDPVYTINGERFATYDPGMTGVKEETAGVTSLACTGGDCSTTLDLAGPKGSDLWLFAKATALKSHFNEMVVLLTPSFDGRAWYTKDAAGMKLVIHGDHAGEVSYRLTAPRFDAASWPNTSTEPLEASHIINE